MMRPETPPLNHLLPIDTHFEERPLLHRTLPFESDVELGRSTCTTTNNDHASNHSCSTTPSGLHDDSKPISFASPLPASNDTTSKPLANNKMVIVGGHESNSILGIEPVKRTLLQYFFVAAGIFFVWRYVLPKVVLGWVFVTPEVLRFEFGSKLAEATPFIAAAFYFLLKVWPVLVTGLPPRPASYRTHWKNDPDFLAKIGVIIPCHKSAAEIGEVLNRVLNFILPEHVIVVDNANQYEPPDDTWRVVRDASQNRVRYLYIAEGFKTRALFHGTLELPPSVEYVLHLDDDTLLPDDMIFDEHHFTSDSQVWGVTYGIRMAGSSAVARCVDWEFVQFSIARTFRAIQSTAMFCHGIVGLWRRDKWTTLLMQHVAMPYGEDAWIGTDTITQNGRIAGELRSWVTTFSPSQLMPTMFQPFWRGAALRCPCTAMRHSGQQQQHQQQRSQGYGASSLWKQRAKRWYTNSPRRLGFRASQFLHYRTSTWRRAIMFRVFMLIHVHRVLFYLATPLCLAYALTIQPWQQVAHLVAVWVSIVTVHRGIRTIFIATLIWYRDPSLAPGLLTLIAYPSYSLFLDLCFLYGHWRSILYYIPFFPIRRGLARSWLQDHNTVVANSALMKKGCLELHDQLHDSTGHVRSTTSSRGDDTFATAIPVKTAPIDPGPETVSATAGFMVPKQKM